MKPLYSMLCVVSMAALQACSPSPHKEDTEASPVAESPKGDALAAAFPENLQASGTEPFWGIKVEGAALTYTTPETMDTPRQLQATRSSDAAGLHFVGENGGTEFRLDVRREACSDGMSEREYPFSVSLLLDGKTAKGCAFDQASPLPPQ